MYEVVVGGKVERDERGELLHTTYGRTVMTGHFDDRCELTEAMHENAGEGEAVYIVSMSRGRVIAYIDENDVYHEC